MIMQNRSRLYGDGFFETIRLRKGEWLYVNEHLERILAGIETLSFSPTSPIDLEWLESTLNEALGSSDLSSTNDLVLRLDFFVQGEERGYAVKDHTMYVSSAVRKIEESSDGIFPRQNEKLDELLSRIANIESLKFAEAKSAVKSFSPVSHLKSTSAITYVQVANECVERDIEDLLILNDKKRAWEFISSNLLVLMNGELFSTQKTDGPVNGTMISYLQKVFHLNFRSFRLDQLAMSDMIMRCNSVRGIHRMEHL